MNRAIQFGVAHCRELLRKFEDATLTGDERDSGLAGPAYEALLILGLRAADVPADDPVLVESFARLQERRMELPQSLSYALMAMSAMRSSRSLTRAESELATRWTKRLIAARDKEGGEHLRWWWEPGPVGSFQSESTWLAILGLDAASRCGVDIPAAAWAGAARHLLAIQQSSGGWDDVHRETPFDCYGAATAGALAALAACERGLSRRVRELGGQIRSARERGFKWLVEHQNFRDGPTILPVYAQYYSEYLFALRMACEWSGIEHLGGRDWYYESAVALCSYLDEIDDFYPSGCSQIPMALTVLRASGPALPITESGR